MKDRIRFLGMTNYCSRFIEGYAEICRPRRELTLKDKPWKWTQACGKAFVTLKDKLCSDTVISYYDPRKPVTVRVDASPVGLGAFLLQDEENVVCYSSRALSPVESRYSHTSSTYTCEDCSTSL